MRRKLSVLLFLIMLVPVSVLAQPETRWARTYGGASWDGCQSIIATADGGFLLTGTTSSIGEGGSDLWLVRIAGNSDIVWTRSFGGAEEDQGAEALQLADGGFLVAGTTESFGGGGMDFWLLRLDENGDSLWTRTYGNEDGEMCSSLIMTADGGFALAGSIGPVGDYRDFYLIKTDVNGNEQWDQRYGGELVDDCSALIQTAGGGFALAGGTESFGAGSCDYWLLKTDENGDSLWSATYGGAGWDNCLDLIETDRGGLALAGRTQSFGAGDYDFWLVRTDAEGDSLWSHTYGRTGVDQCYSMQQTPDGGFSLAGGRGTTRGDFWLVRCSADGDSLYSSTFGAASTDICYSHTQTDDGGFAMAGYTYSSGAGESDFWVVRTSPDPQAPSNFELLLPLNGDTLEVTEVDFVWETSIDPDGEEIEYRLCMMIGDTSRTFSLDDTLFFINLDSLRAEPGGSYVVNWWVEAVSPPYTIECDERFSFTILPLAVSDDTPDVPARYGLMTPYPNPFNSSISVGYRVARPGVYALDIIDPQGKILGIISRGYQTAGEHRIVWGADNLPGGSYWLRLSDAQGGKDVKPIVLVR